MTQIATPRAPAKGKNLLLRIFYFYYDGFRSMTLGKTLWLIIFIKLFIMFAILRVFLFPNFLNSKFENDTDRGNHVIEQLIKQP